MKGQSESICRIHYWVLVQHSKKLVQLGSTSGTITLDVTPTTLLLFSNWAYTGHLEFANHAYERCPTQKQCIVHSGHFEVICQLGMEDEQIGTATAASYRDWPDKTRNLKNCTMPGFESYDGPFQSHMHWLVDLYEFASTFSIQALELDIVQAIGIAMKVARELPGLDVLNKAVSANPESLLARYLKDVYDLNWSLTIATKLKVAKSESWMHSEVVDIIVRNLVEDLETSQLEKENLSQEINVTKTKQAKRDKAIIRELGETTKALAAANAQIARQKPTQKDKEAQIQLAKAKKALADAQTKIAQLEEEKSLTQSQKRAREDDGEMVAAGSARSLDGGLDASEIFRQSLKKPRRTLRSRTSGASSTLPS